MKPRKTKILDAHIYSNLSCGELGIDQIKKICAKKKYDVGICDRVSTHSKINSEKKFVQYLSKISGHKVQKSAEFDISCGIKLSLELIEQLDYVVRGLHHFKTERSDTYIDFPDEKASVTNLDYFRDWTLDQIARTIETETIDILAHPTLLPVCLRDSKTEVYTDEWKSDLIKLAAMNEVALEINNRFRVPDESFITECLKYGVNVSLGSGAITKQEVGNLEYPLSLVQKLEIPEFLIFPNNNIDIDAF